MAAWTRHLIMIFTVISALAISTLTAARSGARVRSLKASAAPYSNGVLRSDLRVGNTTLPAGTELFRTSSKQSLLYRTPGMPGGQYLGISRRAFGRALGRSLAASNKRAPGGAGDEKHGKAPADLVRDIHTGRGRHHAVHDAVRLSSRQLAGVEHLSRMFGLPDATRYNAMPRGLKERMTKTITMGDTKVHDGRVSGVDTRNTLRQFAARSGALKVATWTSESIHRGNTTRRRGLDTTTTWRGNGDVRVDYTFTVGKGRGRRTTRGSGALKRLARALGLDVWVGDSLSYSLEQSAAGAMTLNVALKERGKDDTIQRGYRVVQQSRGVLFTPIGN